MNTVKATDNTNSKHTFINDIQYSTLEKWAFIILTIFITHPFTKFVITSLTSVGEGAAYRVFWADYNIYALFLGCFTLVLYILKLRNNHQLPNIKAFLEDNIPLALFGIFALLMIISTLINGFPKLSILGNDYRNEGLLGFLSYLVYFLLAAFCLNDHLRNILLHILAITSSIIGLATIYDFFILYPHYGMAHEGVLFSHFNHFGYYLLIGALVLALLFINTTTLYKKLLYCVGYIITLCALIANDTFGCQVALFATFIFIGIVYSIVTSKFHSGALLITAVSLITYLVLCCLSEDILKYVLANFSQSSHDLEFLTDSERRFTKYTSGVSRSTLWNFALEFVAEKPFFGHAADTTGGRLLDLASNDRCHSEYLNYAVSFGIPAALIYMAAVFTVYLRGLKHKKTLTPVNLLGLCVAFAYLVSAIIGNSMYYTTPFLFIMLGLGYAKSNNTDH